MDELDKKDKTDEMDEITDKWNFDEVIDRKCYGTVKWDPFVLKMFLGAEDLLPLWVADMDFRAPEPILKAMIDRVNHGIFGYTLPEEDYYQAIKIAVKGGVKQLKLYFMLGLPGEKDDDVAAIARFLNNLVDLGFNRSRAIRVSINPFIPKAWTPFQWANFIDEKSYKTRCLMLRKLTRKPQIEISCLNYKWALIQAILSIGGSELSPIIQYVAENGGRLSAWRKALKKYVPVLL